MARWGLHALRSANAGGLVLAGLGFVLTRFTVTLVHDDPLRFVLVGFVPLVLGLTVAVAGVVLAVGAFEPDFARTTALWSLIGTGTMAALVVLTLYGIEPGTPSSLASVRSKTHLSNFLIGGSFGGALTGVYAARNRRERREQLAQAKRMVVLNRLLRDQALNSITAIRGHLDLLRDEPDAADRADAIDVLEQQSSTLETAVQKISHLSTPAGAAPDRLEAVPVAAAVRDAAESARAEYPDAEVVVGELPPDLSVRADEMLGHVLELLIENAVEHNDAPNPRVEVAVRRDGPTARLTVVDDGPGLSVEQQAIVDHGSVADFDDPHGGFGLNVVSLLVESYGGEVESHVLDTGTRIDVTLTVAGADREPATDPASVRAVGPAKSRLALGGAAALLAGVVMGVTMSAMTDLMPVVGTLYDAPDPVVGWVTHEFHSLVFGVAFVGLLSVAPPPYDTSHAGRIAVGVGWGLYLWLVAAGFLMPLWLLLVGQPASVPNLTPASLVGHVVWGATLGGVYSYGCTAVGGRIGDLSLPSIPSP